MIRSAGMRRSRLLAFVPLLAAACSRTPPPAKVDVAPDAAAAAPAPAPAAPPDACPGDPDKGVTCRRFTTAEDAFRHVVGTRPAVLAVGEAHAQKGTEAIASSIKRFSSDLLPIVADRSADIVVELWAPDPRCQREVKAVASAQKPVTETQAETNPNEYQALGVRAKKLGLTPWLLRPTCDDFSMLADAGADVVPAMLGLVKRLTQEKVLKLAAKNEKAGKMTIAYGGALHNDLAPAEATAAYSFGPEVARAVAGSYVELDLIVPELVKKTEVWEKLPWFAAWEKDGAVRDRATLYTISHGEGTPPSYVLVFASSRR